MEPPLIGRRAELGRLTGLLDGQNGKRAVLIGPAGVGKSRLAEELAAEAGYRGWDVFWARGSRNGRTVPFGAFANLLPQPFNPSSSRIELLHSLATHLIRPERPEPTMVVVEDVAHLDEASLALLHLLATSDRVVTVMTHRSDERSDGDTPLARLVGTCEFVEVPPLPRAETYELAEAILKGPIGGTTLSELWRLTRGNPLYVVETIRAGLQDGVITEVEGMWRHVSPLGRTEQFAALIENRLSHLEEGDRAALDLVAVGEPMELVVLERAIDPDRLVALESENLIEIDGQGSQATVRCHHPLYGELLRERMPRMSMRMAARRLSDALAEVRHDLPGRTLRLALWKLEAGDTTDHETLVDAAREAMSAHEPRLAEVLARTAVEADGGEAARLILGQALAGLGRHEEAETEFAALTTEGNLAAVTPRAWNLVAGLNDAPAALEVIEAAAAESDADWAGGILAAEATIRSFLGDLTGALDASRRILEQDGDDPGTVVEALTIHTAVDCLLGRPAAALTDTTKGIALAATLEEPVPHAETKLFASRILAIESLGRLQDAEAEAGAAYQDALDDHAWHRIGAYGMVYGLTLLAIGRLEECLNVTAEALVAIDRTDPLASRAGCWTLRALALAQMGDADGAHAALGELDDHHQGSRFFVHAARARSWARAAEGRLGEAAELALEAAADPTISQFTSWTPGLLHDVVRFGFPDQVVDRLAELAHEVDGKMVSTLARHARAAVSGGGAVLEEAATALELLGADLIAAEAFAAASGAYRREGNAGSGLRSERRATRLVLGCQGAATPGLVGQPEPLTTRQREVARMAARGLTNREIGERLYVSPRTVENHLAQVYARLGISGRGELPFN